MKLILPMMTAFLVILSLTSLADTKPAAAQQVRQIQQEIARIEVLCVPAKRTTRKQVEQRFGLGQPSTNQKVLPKNGVTQNSPYRSYAFCPNGTLFVCYDKDWNLLWAGFLDPFSVKGRVPGPIPPAVQLKELEPRLKQMKLILREYQRRFPETKKH